MNSNKYDVVVVGAGPGGSTTARVTAEAGLKTLLLERRHIVGEPVQCGEFLPIPAEVARMFPKCDRASRLVQIPNSVIRNRCSKLKLISPRLRKYEFEMISNVIDRAGFDQHLAEKAVASGAELSLSSWVVGRQGRNRVVYRKDGNLVSVDAGIIIGADGPRSLIAKTIGSTYSRPIRDISASIQYVMEGVDCDSDATAMYFSSQIAPGGYAWIIPQSSSTANVGFGARRPFTSDSVPLRAYLERFIQSHPDLRNGSIKNRVSASIPVGGPVTKSVVENVLLVGDAAGHVMSTNGGGIPTALIGGEIAGNSVVRHQELGVPLSEYEREWKTEIGSELYISRFILRIADAVMRSDVVTEIGMRLSGSRYLEDVIRCRLPQPMGFTTKILSRILKWVSQ